MEAGRAADIVANLGSAHKPKMRCGVFRAFVPCALATLLLGALAPPTEAQIKDLFEELRGNWRGSGVMSLSENRRSRIVCDSTYTGTATQLALTIACKSDFRDIKLRAKLSRNIGRLTGLWTEESYNATGSITGVASPNRIRFRIGGTVLGTMEVTYSARAQKVVVETQGIPLEKMEITMRRR